MNQKDLFIVFSISYGSITRLLLDLIYSKTEEK